MRTRQNTLRRSMWALVSLSLFTGMPAAAVGDSIADSSQTERLADTSHATAVQDTSGIYKLGEITVVGHHASKAEDLGSVVDKGTIAKENIKDVADAAATLPGIDLENIGPRNERQIFIRGFSSQEIGLYIDGIPIYVPYDGNIDLARFSTFDAGKISVEKGLTSILYGPNTMGGVINIVSRKPTSPLDVSGDIGANNLGFTGDANLGSRQGAWYGMLSLSYIDQGDYHLSPDFTAAPKDVKEGSIFTRSGGDIRANSAYSDDKVSLRLGYNPEPGDEISIIGQMQHGVKGVSPYAGEDTASADNKYRFWKWPFYDVNSAYLIGNWQFGSAGYTKASLYYVNYHNSLNAYDDSTYSTQLKGSSFKSIYNDYSAGGEVEYGNGFSSSPEFNDSLKANLRYKYDVHYEENWANDTSSSSQPIFPQEPDIYMKDQTVGIGVENAMRFGKEWSIVPGIGYNIREVVEADSLWSNVKPGKKIYQYSLSQFQNRPAEDALDGQIALYYQPDDRQTLSASVARRTRFPNMKDRYSFRLGTAIPNPSLSPEYAINTQLSYAANLFKGFNVDFSLFESQLYNVIMTINNVDSGKSQQQNAGRARFAGPELDSTGAWALPAPELSLTYKLPLQSDWLHALSMFANGSYITHRNLTTPALYFVDLPTTEIRAGIDYFPLEHFGLSSDLQYGSQRSSTSNGQYRTSPFTVFNLRGEVPVKWFTLYAGCTNVGNVNYSLSEGYPEEGRGFYGNISFNFKK